MRGEHPARTGDVRSVSGVAARCGFVIAGRAFHPCEVTQVDGLQRFCSTLDFRDEHLLPAPATGSVVAAKPRKHASLPPCVREVIEPPSRAAAQPMGAASHGSEPRLTKPKLGHSELPKLKI